ncbi:glutamine-hydrolyzing carbamoyl-phosphate synthase small subunit [Candidatus Daviesbacteria bacterium]|nr:glutamine-hydrolyzing carbamoyl-phosphate synthase small subunit [Candidatus Daviesbacteria bacterium]
MTGKLVLSDGTVFLGESFGADISTSGEVVFNTGMVGYPESLTDASYFGQILVMTYPLQGNYGVPPKEFWESKRIQVKALIVQNYIDNPSHFESRKTLSEWLKEEGIPALQGIDTRMLARKLREHGVMLGKVQIESKSQRVKESKYSDSSDSSELKANNDSLTLNQIYDPNSENILPFVSTKEVQVYGEGKKNIVLIDCGAKENIVRSLVKRGVRVTRVPWDFNPLMGKSDSSGRRIDPRNDKGGGLDFDAVLVSNGPGDPSKAVKTISNVRQILSKNIPTFGICLGSQIIALASGAKTYKLKFGHRAQNQPVQDQISKKAIITSQNHGFAVDVETLSKDWEEWFLNLNDGTNEGVRHRKKPFMAVQFHPEASPGPADGGYLFDEFLERIK